MQELHVKSEGLCNQLLLEHFWATLTNRLKFFVMDCE